MPDFTASLLHAKIATVCPAILGVRIEDPTNAASWTIDYAPTVIPAQRAAAVSLLATITPAKLATANATVTAAKASIVDPLIAAKASAMAAL